MSTGQNKAGHTDERHTGAGSPQPSGRCPVLSCREAASALSLVFIIALAALFAFKDADNPLAGNNPVRAPEEGEIMTIDGNRNGTGVTFTHRAHIPRAAQGQEGCTRCHHLARPGKGPSSCSGCHRNMYRKTRFFDHDGHIAVMAESGSCSACHQGDRSRKNIRPCSACHNEYGKKPGDYRSAPPYRDALHELCYRCHGQGGTQRGGGKHCTFCHDEGTIMR